MSEVDRLGNESNEFIKLLFGFREVVDENEYFFASFLLTEPNIIFFLVVVSVLHPKVSVLFDSKNVVRIDVIDCGSFEVF